MELRAVTLFDNENASFAGERRGEALGLGWGQQPERHEASLNAVLGSAPNRFARGSGQRTPSDNREITRALDCRPVVAEGEPRELVAALIELRVVIVFAACRDSALGVSQAVGGVLTATCPGNCHGRNAVGRKSVSF